MKILKKYQVGLEKKREKERMEEIIHHINEKIEVQNKETKNKMNEKMLQYQ